VESVWATPVAVERIRAVRKAQETQFAGNVLPIIRDIQGAGHTSLNANAGQLNARRVATANGGQWRHVQVRQILDRRACAGRVIAGRPSAVVLHHLDEHRGCSTG
jgi:Recombinase